MIYHSLCYIIALLKCKFGEKMLYQLLNYIVHTFSLIPYGLKFVLIKIIGSIRSLFGFEDVLVIGGGYALEKQQGFRYSEYERLVRATGCRYYANVGYQNNTYVNRHGVCVQLWKNARVLRKNWKDDGYFSGINKYFGSKKFKNIIVDYSVLQLMSSTTYNKWLDFIKTHISETGVVTLPGIKESEEQRDQYRREFRNRSPHICFFKDNLDVERDLRAYNINCQYTQKHAPV